MNKMLTFCLLLSVSFLFAGQVSAQTISIPDTTAFPGSTIMIPVYTTEVELSDDIQAYQMIINFDPAVAEVEDYDIDNTITPSNWINIYNFTNPGAINGGAFMAPSPYLEGEGVLVYFVMNIPANATGMTDLSFTSFTYNDDLITTIDGSITIETLTVTVNGMAYLQNQTIHGGISILFDAVVGGTTAETITDDTGAYSLELEPGTYDVTYSYPGFETIVLEDQVLDVNTTLPDVTLNELPSVTIDGFVFLEGQTVHTGSLVEFIAAGPGGVSDQTTTISDGSYTIDLFPGLYDITFSHDGYEPQMLEGEDLQTSAALDDVTLVEIPAIITVSIPDTTYDRETYVQLPIYISTVSMYHEILAYSFQVDFDEELMVGDDPVFDITGSITPEDWNTQFEAELGAVEGGSFTVDPENPLMGEGLLVTLNFFIPWAPETASTTVEFSLFLFNFGEPEATTVNGSVEVVFTSVEDSAPGVIPETFALHQNFPNPFNPATAISFDIAEKSRVKLSVYNVLGELVTVLQDGEMNAGQHQMEFGAEGLPSGLYFYRLTAGGFTETRKMMLIE